MPAEELFLPRVIVRRAVTNIIAGMLGFEKKGYFTAPEEAVEPVEVEFDF